MYVLTGYEDVFIRGSNELECSICEKSEVFVDCVSGDIFIGTVVQCNEDVEEDYAVC